MLPAALFPVADFSALATAPIATKQIALRQLRHLTRNALQQVIGQIENTPALQEGRGGRGVAQDLVRRIKASVAVSDCLFGLTAETAPLEERLRGLCDNLLVLFAEHDLAIRIEISVRGECPAELGDAVIGIAHEFVGNALRHGMYARAAGRVLVRLVSSAERTTLSVCDDGWGLEGGGRPGEGLVLAREMAARHGGHISLRRERETEAQAVLPHGEQS